MIVNALAGKPLPVYGDGQQVRDWLYVEGPLRGDPRGAGARPRRRDLQHRRLEREAEPRDRPRRVRPARRAKRPHPDGRLCAPRHARHRPARPRPPLCDRREQDRARARLAAGRDLRDRAAQDGALVPRQRRPGSSACRAAPTATGSSAQLRAAHEREDPAARQERPGRLGAAALARAARRGDRGRHRQRAALAADFSTPDALRALVGARRAGAHRQCRGPHRGRQGREPSPSSSAPSTPTAAGVLAREAAARGAWLVHYSTDYVFDGSGSAPWPRTIATAPLSVYGRTKLEGEEPIRAQRLPAPDLAHQLGLRARAAATSPRRCCSSRGARVADGHRRPDRRADRRRPARRPHRAWRSAHRRGEARALAGTYHAVAAGETSWHGYARHVIEFARARGEPSGRAEAIAPIPSTAYRARPRRGR